MTITPHKITLSYHNYILEVSPNYPQTFVPQSTPVRKPASTVGGFLAGGPSLLALLRTIIRGILSPAQANSVLSSRSARPPLASHLQSQANPSGPLPGDRLPPGGAAPISIANGPVPSLQYANPWMGGHQPLHTAVSGKSGAGQPIRHPASHLPGTGGRQPLHIAVNGKSGVGQPIRHPASLLPGTGGSLQAGNIPQVPIGVQSGPIATQSQANPNGPLPTDRLPPGGAAPISIANGPVPSLQYANPSMGGYQPLHTAVNGKSGAGQPIRHPASLLPGTGGSLQAGKITQLPIGVQSGPITTPGQPTRHPASSVSGTGGSIQTGNIPAGSIGVHSGPITTPVQVPLHVLTSTMKTPLSIHLKPPFGEQPFIGLGSLHSGGSLPELPEPAEPNAGEHESVEPAIGKQIPAAILERMRTMHNSPKLKPGVGVPPVSISPSLAPPTYGGPSTRSASTSFVAPTQPSLDALLSQLEGHRPVRKRQKASELPAGATTSPGGLAGGISRVVIDTSTTTVVSLHVRPETSPTVHVSRISNSSEPPAITQSTNSTSRGWSATPNLQRNGPVYTQPSTTTAQSTTRTRTTATVQPSRSTIASIWDLIFGLPTSAPHYPLFDTTQSNYYSISGRSDCDCNRKDDSCPTGKIYAGECHDGIRCCDSW